MCHLLLLNAPLHFPFKSASQLAVELQVMPYIICTHYSSMLIFIIIIIVSPMDYGALCTILAFAACETRQCVNMTIVDDFEVEPNEDFLYTLERAPGLNFYIRLNPVEGEVIIFDNDGT